MRRLIVSAAALAGLVALIVGVTAYERTFHPAMVEAKRRARRDDV